MGIWQDWEIDILSTVTLDATGCTCLHLFMGFCSPLSSAIIIWDDFLMLNQVCILGMGSILSHIMMFALLHSTCFYLTCLCSWVGLVYGLPGHTALVSAQRSSQTLQEHIWKPILCTISNVLFPCCRIDTLHCLGKLSTFRLFMTPISGHAPEFFNSYYRADAVAETDKQQYPHWKTSTEWEPGGGASPQRPIAPFLSSIGN